MAKRSTKILFLSSLLLVVQMAFANDENETPPPRPPQDSYSEPDKHQLKAKILPLFQLAFDYGSYIVNLTPQFKKTHPNLLNESNEVMPLASSDSLVYGDYSGGFQKTVYGNLEIGIGAQIAFLLKNASGLANYIWAYVGVVPIIGKDTASVRFVSTLEKAKALGGRWSVPKFATDLNVWDSGDSITYTGHGGLVFSGGVTAGPVGIGIAKLGMGIWETYIEKVGSDKVYVKMTRGKLNSLSVFTSATVVELSVKEFGSADDGFSFLFDLSTDLGRKAYEDMIRGNVFSSEKIASNKPRNLVEKASVIKVETFTVQHLISFKHLNPRKLISELYR